VIEIPPSRLAPALLEAIIEAFILREGTDYGAEEISLERKIAQVKRQIEKGTVVIVFDEDSESCNLLRRDDFLQP
jgi:uncharacterized protein YheU (UPF0270 family)